MRKILPMTLYTGENFYDYALVPGQLVMHKYRILENLHIKSFEINGFKDLPREVSTYTQYVYLLSFKPCGVEGGYTSKW